MNRLNGAADECGYAAIATPVTSAQMGCRIDCGRNETRQRCLGWAAGKDVGDLVMGGKKPLHLPRRLEALHEPLPSPGRLVGILRPVVETLML